MSKSIQGSLAELAHNRHTEIKRDDFGEYRDGPGSLFRAIEVGQALGQLNPKTLAMLYFMTAVQSHFSGDEHAELGDFEAKYGQSEGFNRWAEKYGLPWEASGPDRNGASRPTRFLPEQTEKDKRRRELNKPHRFKIRTREANEGAKEYASFVKAELRRIDKQINGLEKERQPEKNRLAQTANVAIHAEWFVLYQYKGWSLMKISCEGPSPKPEGSPASTIHKGIRTFAKVIGADLRD